jgi:hypothetical protein
MRLVLLTSTILAASVFAAPSPGNAQINYPWCAQYSGVHGGGRNCGFVSWQQCMATAHGLGGICERNLFYTGPETVVRRHKKTMRRDY